MPQCIPIRDLKNTSEISILCQQTHGPIYITKNGYTDMVIMSASTYEKIRVLSVYEKLIEAEDDVAEGRVSDAFTSLRQMRMKYGL